MIRSWMPQLLASPATRAALLTAAHSSSRYGLQFAVSRVCDAASVKINAACPGMAPWASSGHSSNLSCAWSAPTIRDSHSTLLGVFQRTSDGHRQRSATRPS